MLKWEAERAFIPNSFSETSRSPCLRVPPQNEGSKNSWSLTFRDCQAPSLACPAAALPQCTRWGGCGLQHTRNRCVPKPEGRWFHESQVRIFFKNGKLNSMIEPRAESSCPCQKSIFKTTCFRKGRLSSAGTSLPQVWQTKPTSHLAG